MEKSSNKKIGLPTAIIIGSIILGAFLYRSQVSKQQSIELQQNVRAMQDELALQQQKCESLSKGVMQQWNNIMGVTYDDTWGECVAIYTDVNTGKVETAPLSAMENSE